MDCINYFLIVLFVSFNFLGEEVKNLLQKVFL